MLNNNVLRMLPADSAQHKGVENSFSVHGKFRRPSAELFLTLWAMCLGDLKLVLSTKKSGGGHIAFNRHQIRKCYYSQLSLASSGGTLPNVTSIEQYVSTTTFGG